MNVDGNTVSRFSRSKLVPSLAEKNLKNCLLSRLFCCGTCINQMLFLFSFGWVFLMPEQSIKSEKIVFSRKLSAEIVSLRDPSLAYI